MFYTMKKKYIIHTYDNVYIKTIYKYCFNNNSEFLK